MSQNHYTSVQADQTQPAEHRFLFCHIGAQPTRREPAPSDRDQIAAPRQRPTLF